MDGFSLIKLMNCGLKLNLSTIISSMLSNEIETFGKWIKKTVANQNFFHAVDVETFSSMIHRLYLNIECSQIKIE